MVLRCWLAVDGEQQTNGFQVCHEKPCHGGADGVFQSGQVQLSDAVKMTEWLQQIRLKLSRFDEEMELDKEPDLEAEKAC